MDFDKYSTMVDGCDKCKVYKKTAKAGRQIICAKYRVSAGPFGMEYFMEHTYEPRKSCMTFHLDYSRFSEFSDTVGYWYVEKLPDGWSRIYYSADSKLPAWVPAFARDKLINMAVSQSTSWVDFQCKLATGKVTGRREGAVKKWVRRLAVVVAAVWTRKHRNVLEKVCHFHRCDYIKSHS